MPPEPRNRCPAGLGHGVIREWVMQESHEHLLGNLLRQEAVSDSWWNLFYDFG